MMQYDQYLELSKYRRTIRGFKPDPIPDDYVMKILDVSRYAMSGANSQPWEFLVVKNPETKEKLVPHGLTDKQLWDPDHNPMVYLVDKQAKENGLIIGRSVNPASNIIRMLPSLIITKEQMDEGLRLLEKTIEQTMKKFGLPKK